MSQISSILRSQEHAVNEIVVAGEDGPSRTQTLAGSSFQVETLSKRVRGTIAADPRHHSNVLKTAHAAVSAQHSDNDPTSRRQDALEVALLLRLRRRCGSQFDLPRLLRLLHRKPWTVFWRSIQPVLPTTRTSMPDLQFLDRGRDYPEHIASDLRPGPEETFRELLPKHSGHGGEVERLCQWLAGRRSDLLDHGRYQCHVAA